MMQIADGSQDDLGHAHASTAAHYAAASETPPTLRNLNVGLRRQGRLTAHTDPLLTSTPNKLLHIISVAATPHSEQTHCINVCNVDENLIYGPHSPRLLDWGMWKPMAAAPPAYAGPSKHRLVSNVGRWPRHLNYKIMPSRRRQALKGDERSSPGLRAGCGCSGIVSLCQGDEYPVVWSAVVPADPFVHAAARMLLDMGVCVALARSASRS